MIDVRAAQSRRRRAGYSFLEVLISLIILAAGVLSVVNFFPVALRSGERARMLSEAALLAHRKAEEIRRDTDASGALIDLIKMRFVPTDPIVFPEDPRMTYSLNGRSLIDPTDDPDDPRDDPFVARVIVRYNRDFRPTEDVIYELRFDL